MDKILSLFNSIQIPLGTAVAGAVLIIGGWYWIDNHYVNAMDFKQAQKSQIIRQITFQERMLENQIFRLELEKATQPQKFSRVDQAVLDRLKKQREELLKDKRSIK